MIERLIENKKYVENIYEDKKKKHMETTEEKYKEIHPSAFCLM